jgi:hypothetical protein
MYQKLHFQVKHMFHYLHLENLDNDDKYIKIELKIILMYL